MCHPACEGHNIIFSNLIESGLALHQTEGNSLVQGDGWSDSGYLSRFKTGSTNQTKNKYFLCVLCVLKRPTGAGERKQTLFHAKQSWDHPALAGRFTVLIKRMA